MSNPIWPETLPVMQLGKSFEPVDPQLRTQMQSGREFVRENFTAVPENFEASWLFTSEQATIFEQFYRTTLRNGTLWFEMPVWLPQIQGNRLVQFRGIYRRQQMTGGLSCLQWQYSANMQHFLRYTDD